MKKRFLILLISLFYLPVYSEERVSLFIDISGSMSEVLPKIQEYITNEYIPSLSPENYLRIYKFYGKLNTKTIYDGNLDSQAKINWVNHQVNCLAANGPWTNIYQVLDFIKSDCSNNGDMFIIFTDGKQELENGSESFEVTEKMIQSRLDENVHIIKKENWEIIEYQFQNSIEEKTINDNITSEVNLSKPQNTITKTKHRCIWFIIGILILLIIILLILLILKSKVNNVRPRNLKIARDDLTDKKKNRTMNLFDRDLINRINSSNTEDKEKHLKITDLSETKQKRMEKESKYEKEILAEAELNQKIAKENPDLITTPDGSYPDYYNQELKIVIMGHEDRGLSGADYIDTLFKAYKEGKIGVNNGYETPDQLGVHRKSLKYSAGLIKETADYDKIPDANELARKLGTAEGHSFAFINESKASNLRDDSQVLNRPQYEDFIERNIKNGYIKSQMEILKPDIVIGMNVNPKTIENLGKTEYITSINGYSLYHITGKDGHKYKFINNKYHFSAPMITDAEEYDIIRKLSKL